MTFLWPTSNMGMLHPAGETLKSRDRASEFRRMAEYARQGVFYQDVKGLFDLSESGVETRVAAFAEVGLLYGLGPAAPLVLTPVGAQMFSLLESTQDFGPEEITRATSLLTWALSNCQIDRPRSPGSPKITDAERKACDIRPYMAAWSLMLDLEGVLYLHEFLGPVRQLEKVDGYDACVAGIRAARAAGTTFANPEAVNGKAPGNPSIYWRSRLSVGGTLLQFNPGLQRLEFAHRGEAVVETILDAQRGSEGDPLSAIAARPWTTIQDYFEVAGRKCPAAILNGSDELPAIDIAVPAAAEGAGPGGAGAAPPAGGQSAEEGERRFRYQANIERSSWASRQAKRLNAARPDHGGKVRCEVCDFAHADFAMLDAHHEQPLSEGVRKTRPEDLRVLCPTCHRRAHRSANKSTPYTLEELRQWVNEGRP